MKRSIFISTLIFFTLCGVASARVFTPPKPEDFKDNYAFVENPDGTYTEYYKGTNELIDQGATYSGDAIAEADRVTAQVAVDAGTTGQDGSIVSGSTPDNISASESIMEDFRTGEWYKTAGERIAGNDLVDVAVAEDTLPSFTAMASAAAGEVFTYGAVVAAGVALGDGIDAVLGFPYINPFAGAEIGNCELHGSCEPTVESIHNYWKYYPEIELGEVLPCDTSGTGPKVGTYPAAEVDPAPEGEVCDFPLMTYAYETYYQVAGKFYEQNYENTIETERGLQNFQEYGSIAPCPVSWVHCAVYREPSEYADMRLWFGLFEPGIEGHFLGFPAGGLLSNGSKSGTLAPLSPRPEITPPLPALVPPVVKHVVIQKAKKKQTKKEKEEKVTPVPLIPPIEEGPKELPNPLNPVVPSHAPNELATDYANKVKEAGFPDTEIKHVPDSAADPAQGPNTVVGVDPTPGTSAPPATKVKISANPEDVPPAEPGKGGIGPPTEPGLKFPDFGVLCKGFPFGVPCWVAKTIEGWSTTGKAPVFGFNFNVKEQEIKGSFDFAKLEPIMEKLRPAMLIFATIGLVLLFYRFAKGGSPTSSSGGGSAGDTTEGEE